MEGNIATWQFNMIKLVDSITNEAKSHGYISFSIKPKLELEIGDSVLNKAAIYFDFNLPVITNNALVAMVAPGCPNGNSWKGTISAAWENPANWSCGVVPDANTDVFVSASATHQPEVNTTTATCRSLQPGAGAHVWIKAGAKLEITGK
jgi:hypothetical protein